MMDYDPILPLPFWIPAFAGMTGVRNRPINPKLQQSRFNTPTSATMQ